METRIKESQNDPSALEIEAIFVDTSSECNFVKNGMAFIAIPRKDQTLHSYHVRKHPLEALLRLTHLAEMQGYKMPVSSSLFAEALGSIHALEATMGTPGNIAIILDLKLPENIMTRKILVV